MLWNYDDIPIVELAKKTELAKTTLTSMLDRMEKNNLLVRRYDKKDRRQIKIQLTDDAKELRNNYEDISAKMTAIYYKGMNQQQVNDFENYLETVLENLME